jgi:hypothetical protein
MDVLALTLSIASIVLSAVAVYVTIKIGVIADRSLKNSTTTGLSGVSQIIRYMERRAHGTPEQAMDVGADVWTCDAVPESIALGEAVKLRLEVWGGGQSSYYDMGETGLVRCTVTMPSGLRAFANSKPVKDEDYECFWEITFPSDFRDNKRDHAGDTNAEGVYLAEWDGLTGDRIQTTAFRVAARVPSLRETLRDLWPS